MSPSGIREEIKSTSIALGVCITVAVALRLLARSRSKANFAIDDLLICLCLPLEYGMIAVGIVAVDKAGVGSPAEELSPSQLTLILKLFMGGIITYTLTITMVKIALLSLYRRIFCTHVFRVKTLIVGCACVTWCLLALLLDIFQCSPIEDAFLPQYLFTDKCIDLQWYYWGTGGTNLLLDVVMLYLPVHMVWGLQLQTRQKALLTGVFSLGGFVLIAGAMRISSIGVLQKEDISVSGAVFYLWSQVEPATAIICASIVTYRPLFTNIHIPSRFPSFSSLLRSKTTSSGSSSGGLGASKHSDGGWNALGSRDHDPLARPNRRHDAEGQFGNIQKKTRIEISSRAYEPDVWESTVETRSHSATVEMF